ncbi:MAG: hypothetical protein AB7S78_10705 [Candidatus Omnitrophota bacterium]
MAHMSLQAQDCRIYIKNGKLRFQASQYDLNGELLDQVTITFPLAVASHFSYVENLDESAPRKNKKRPGKISNRLRNFMADEKQE